MNRILLVVTVAVLVAVLGAGAARAGQPPLDLAGQPYYFSGSCSGLGDVIAFNQSLAPRPALVLVAGRHGAVVPTYDNPHARANGTCTFTGGGFSIATIQPFDEPIAFDALIVP